MGDKQNASANKSGGVKELIAKHINNLDEHGKLKLSDELSEVEKELIRQAKRTRDAQSALSKQRLEAEKLAREKEELTKIARGVVPEDFKLSDQELQEIEALKTTDPEQYRIRVNKLEADALTKQEQLLAEIAAKAEQEAKTKVTAETHSEVLEEFRQANPDIPLTDEVLVNDVPPRFAKGLNEGKYDYRTYLDKVAEFLKTQKKIVNPEGYEDKNLGSVPGDSKPGSKAANNQGKQDYKKMTF